jgi:FdhD protein
MARRRSERTLVSTVTGRGGDRTVKRSPDELIVEEPMSIELDGELVATTMRTPGNDFELAVGFCRSEGLLDGATLLGVRYCADGSAVESDFNIVTVETDGAGPSPTPRLGNVSSSCGWCGSDQLDDLDERIGPLAPTDPFDLDVVGSIPDIVLGGQSLFAKTGSVHAAAVFDRDASVVITREDVGRHNAVDKIVGALALDHAPGLPARGFGLFVSGRASIEMVQKAWVAGFDVLVAVSAPTSLAVDAARRANLGLVGFVRNERFNVYAPERL